MSTSITLLDQNSNANNVDIMVFEPSLLFPPCRSFFLGGGGGDRCHGPIFLLKIQSIYIEMKYIQMKYIRVSVC